MFQRSFLLVCILHLFSCAYASSIEEVSMVCGESVMSGNTTLDEAKKSALQDAKTNALRRAGVEETIRSNQLLSSQQADRKTFAQQFTEFTNTEISGDIVDYKLLKDYEITTNRDGISVCKVCIDAKVKKYDTKRDLKFDFKLDSLSAKYSAGDELTFVVRPLSQGFLKVFLIDGTTQADIIYPNAYEAITLFEAKKSIRLPSTTKIRYTLTKSDTKSNSDINYLVLVYTKEEYPFMDKVNPENILKWIASIEPSQRAVKFETLVIW